MSICAIIGKPTTVPKFATCCVCFHWEVILKSSLRDRCSCQILLLLFICCRMLYSELKSTTLRSHLGFDVLLDQVREKIAVPNKASFKGWYEWRKDAMSWRCSVHFQRQQVMKLRSTTATMISWTECSVVLFGSHGIDSRPEMEGNELRTCSRR